MKIRVVNTVLNLNGNANVGDTHWDEMIEFFLEGKGAPAGLTVEQKLDFVALELKRYFIEVSKGVKRSQKQTILEKQLAAEVANFD